MAAMAELATEGGGGQRIIYPVSNWTAARPLLPFESLRQEGSNEADSCHAMCNRLAARQLISRLDSGVSIDGFIQRFFRVGGTRQTSAKAHYIELPGWAVTTLSPAML